MTWTIPTLTIEGVTLCALLASCSSPTADGEPRGEPLADGSAAPEAELAAALRPGRGASCSNPAAGRACAVTTIDCGVPPAPAHGTVHAPVTRYGATATYACTTDFALTGTATRTCQTDGTWSGTAPTCTFVRAGAPCGSCGGVYDGDGGCSVPTPANLGATCDVGPGKGACTASGTIVCDGTCQPSDPSIGDPTAWHIFAAPNGSWDWDCDGAVTAKLHAVAPPADCGTFADADGCQAADAIDYVTEDVPCGLQAVLFTRDCQWTTVLPTCLNTPASHHVTFQQCR